MQFQRSAVVWVLLTIYLSTECLCHYIPENTVGSHRKNEASSQRDRIQICGNALTTMIIEACDGIVSSLDQAYQGRENIQTKITEDCCDRECPLDYLQNFCGQTPLFTTKKSVRGKLLSKLNPRNRISKGRNQLYNVMDDKMQAKKGSQNQRQNNISRTWPSIQIGTISPEIDKFGGQPVVVVNKKSSNENRKSI